MLTFNFTGASTSFVVPNGVGSFNATVVRGGSGGNCLLGTAVIPGGLAGQVTGTFPVTEGETLTVTVGGKGGDGTIAGAGTGAFGDGTGGTGFFPLDHPSAGQVEEEQVPSDHPSTDSSWLQVREEVRA